MSEKKEKIYLPSSIKRVTTQYGELFNANFKMEDLQKNAKNGWVSMVIAERREPSEKGATHYSYVNDYEPPKPKQENKSTNKTDSPF